MKKTGEGTKYLPSKGKEKLPQSQPFLYVAFESEMCKDVNMPPTLLGQMSLQTQGAFGGNNHIILS